MVKILHYCLLILLCSLPLLLTSSILFLKDPPIWPDEPVFYEMAQNFLSTGKLASNLYIGTASEVAETGFGYPPLYFGLLGIWTGIFGSSIESVRSLSLILGLSCLSVFFFLIRNLFKSNFLSVLGTLVLAFQVHFSRSSRIGRMEILTLLLLLGSLFMLQVAEEKKKLYLYFLIGLISALATLSHPMGIISPIIIFFYLLFTSSNFKEKIIHLCLVSLPVILLNIFWLIVTKVNLLFLLSTYQGHLQDKAPKLPYAVVLFQTDFSWWFLFILYIVLFIVFLGFIKKMGQKEYLLILISVFVSFILSLWGREGCYIIYFQPFIILIALFLLNIGQKLNSQTLRKTVLAIISLIILASLNIQFFNNDNIAITRGGLRTIFDIAAVDYHLFGKEIIKKLPADQPTNILISSLPDPYFDLKEINQFRFYEAPDPFFPISKENYKKVLDSTDYLVITWFPQQFLKDYVDKNSETITTINPPNSYQALLIKLKPRTNRQ
ncbi:MAG: glycosyltransferase family 39 protein [Candidatus Daviesbacteria bacterium]